MRRIWHTGLGGIVLVLLFACALPTWVVVLDLFVENGRWSLDNFAAAGRDLPRWLHLLATTGKVTAGTVAIAIAGGAPLGFLLFRTDLPFRTFFRFVCLASACLPLYVTVTAWMAVSGMAAWLGNVWGAAWIQGVAYMPLAAGICGAIFCLNRSALEDAGRMEGSGGQVFMRVALTQGLWGIGMASACVAVLAVLDITVTDILVIRTFGEEIFTSFQTGTGVGSALVCALPMLCVVAAGLWWMQHVLRRHGVVAGPATERALAPWSLGHWRWPVAACVGLGWLLLGGVPFWALLRATGSAWALVAAWKASSYEFWGTLWISPLAATGCVLLALPGGWLLSRRGLGRAAMTLLLVLLLVPAPVTGIGLIRLFNRPGLAGLIYDSQAILVIVYALRALPFALLVVWAGMMRVPAALDEAVVLEGGTVWDRIRTACLPVMWRSLLAAWFVALVVILGELGASFLVVPPGRTTLSLRFFTLIHYGVYPDAAGICLILLGCVGIGAAALAWLGTGVRSAARGA